eukprot:1194837-Prorocentrum_minimum.AAC.8
MDLRYQSGCYGSEDLGFRVFEGLHLVAVLAGGVEDEREGVVHVVHEGPVQFACVEEAKPRGRNQSKKVLEGVREAQSATRRGSSYLPERSGSLNLTEPRCP